MRRYLVALLVILIVLGGCAREEGDELSFREADAGNQRPFGRGGDQRITFEGYLNALYEDNAGRSASATEISRARAAYGSGQSLEQIVSGILGSEEFAPALKRLEDMKASRRPSPHDGRGFRANDLLLLYLAFSDSYKPPPDYKPDYSTYTSMYGGSYAPSWTSHASKFFSSRSYVLDYLLYYYLLK